RMEQAWAERGLVLPYEAFYFRAHTYRLGEISIYTTGLAVLVNVQTLRVDAREAEPITHYHVRRWKDRKQSRICAHLRLTDPVGRPLHVFNTHLSLPTPFAR